MSLEKKYRYPKKKKEFTIFGIQPMMFIIVSFFTFVISYGLGKFHPSLDNKPRPPIYDESAAKYSCEKFILQALKAPSSADFAPIHKVSISGYGAGPWTVNGYVDAQNSFGAKLRQSYSCVIEFSGDKTRLISLNLN